MTGRSHAPRAGAVDADAPDAPVRVRVDVSPAYDVTVGAGILDDLGRRLPDGRVARVSDATVDRLHGRSVDRALRDLGREVLPLVVPPGEETKGVATWADLLRRLTRAGFDRGDVVLALGGGVVGDLAGFVAASYMRGIAFVQAPTTLLAMADAAIGGKTGLNLPEGKNLVGAFWQPRAVWMDVRTLRTLPERVMAQGAVEVFKHGLLADEALARAVLDGALTGDAPDGDLVRLVAASASVKAAIVAGDEREAGARATLNLGHTVGHALEAASGHTLTHGESIAWGLLYTAHLSRLEGSADWSDLPRRLLARLAPAPLPTDAWEDLVPFLRRDKKNLAGRQRWVLLSRVGAPYLADAVPAAHERAAWRALADDAAAMAATPGEGGAGATPRPPEERT